MSRGETVRRWVENTGVLPTGWSLEESGVRHRAYVSGMFNQVSVYGTRGGLVFMKRVRDAAEGLSLAQAAVYFGDRNETEVVRQRGHR